MSNQESSGSRRMPPGTYTNGLRYIEPDDTAWNEEDLERFGEANPEDWKHFQHCLEKNIPHPYGAESIPVVDVLDQEIERQKQERLRQKVNFVPCNGYILVEPIQPPTTSQGGITLPENHRMGQLWRGYVVAVEKTGFVSKGDVAFFSAEKMLTLSAGDDGFVLVHKEDLMGYISQEDIDHLDVDQMQSLYSPYPWLYAEGGYEASPYVEVNGHAFPRENPFGEPFDG